MECSHIEHRGKRQASPFPTPLSCLLRSPRVYFRASAALFDPLTHSLFFRTRRETCRPYQIAVLSVLYWLELSNASVLSNVSNSKIVHTKKFKSSLSLSRLRISTRLSFFLASASMSFSLMPACVALHQHIISIPRADLLLGF